jgi:glucose-6-phosphate isomerase
MTDTDAIRLDYGNMMAPRLDGRGLDPDAVSGLADRFRAIQDDVRARRDSGELGFYALTERSELTGEIESFADGPGQAFENVVVLGIGGSALGATALLHALRGADWNQRSAEDRDHFPRLFVLDNVDPDTVASLLDRIDVRRTLFNVISKSGTTAETMSQFLIVRERLRDAIHDEDGVRRHLLFTTDPESGVLRKIAADEGVVTLPDPTQRGRAVQRPLRRRAAPRRHGRHRHRAPPRRRTPDGSPAASPTTSPTTPPGSTPPSSGSPIPGSGHRSTS